MTTFNQNEVRKYVVTRANIVVKVANEVFTKKRGKKGNDWRCMLEYSVFVGEKSGRRRHIGL